MTILSNCFDWERPLAELGDTTPGNAEEGLQSRAGTCQSNILQPSQRNLSSWPSMEGKSKPPVYSGSLIWRMASGKRSQCYLFRGNVSVMDGCQTHSFVSNDQNLNFGGLSYTELKRKKERKYTMSKLYKEASFFKSNV